MATSMSESLNDTEIRAVTEKEFSDLFDEWKNKHRTTGYDPVPYLSKCAKTIEDARIEFFKGDPDPYDDRHPQYVQRGCMLGKLLLILTKTDDLLQKLVSTYIWTPTGVNGITQVSLLAARILLAGSHGFYLPEVLKLKEGLTEQMLLWLREAPEPAQTYATGILIGALKPLKTSTSEFLDLISILLKRLWNHVRPGMYPGREYEVCQDDDISGSVDSRNSNTSSNKRKRSVTAETSKSKKLIIDNPGTSSFAQTLTPRREISSNNTTRLDSRKEEKASFLSEFYDNDLSNSSWTEQMHPMLGCSYSLEHPMLPSIRQVYIFNLLKDLAEYQDLLSIFLELKTLDLITVFLKERKSDGLLTFKVLELLASLLCHNKVATELIELDGVKNLLFVPRPSMGSSGVSRCLYFLAYRKETMERICRLPSHVLSEMVKYVIWLLECSHESGRSYAISFFSVAFSFRVILNLFDKMNGLRCILNNISTLKQFTDSQNNANNQDDEHRDIRHDIRTVCGCLKKYFEAHLQIKTCSTLKILPKSKQTYSIESVSKYKSMICSREQFLECLEILGEHAEEDPNVTRALNNWPPVLGFSQLDGVQLMLKVIDVAYDWTNHAVQMDVVRSTLDVLAVATLYQPSLIILTEQQHMAHIKMTGIGTLLSIASGVIFLKEGEAQKSALAVIINCVGSSTATARGTTRHIKKHRKVKDDLWRHIQHSVGIDVLLTLLTTTKPALHADQLRYLACKALLGLTSYKPACQIVSKLSVFENGQIQYLAKGPVLNGKKRIHEKFCRLLELLYQKVSGKPINLHINVDVTCKSLVVSETPVRYKSKELLSMVHNHLIWAKLPKTAEMLVQEAGLFDMEDHNGALSQTSGMHNQKFRSLMSESGDGSSVSRRISFTKGDRALGSTPTPTSVVSVTTPDRRTFSRPKTDYHYAYANSDGQRRFKLSRNGVITAKPKSISRSDLTRSPPTLNSLVEENFLHQHSRCQNPVVSVPEFSFFMPHCCPEQRCKVDASNNFTKRSFHRQGIRPIWGGVRGFVSDLQLIYSRYKPGSVIKGFTNDRKKVTFCSAAFMPNNKELILGDTQGCLHVQNLFEDEIEVIQGVANSGASIFSLQPSHHNDLLLVTSSSIWSENCSLHSLGEQVEQKFIYEDTDYVEFCKPDEAKVIGTKEHKALLFDTATGELLNTFEREDMSCFYKENRATCSPDGKLILCDGLLWDIRASQNMPIHKFDQFNSNVSGIFHPNGLEAIINTEVWDLRNYHLLRTVPNLDQCILKFNGNGSVIYTMRQKNDTTEEEESASSNALMFSSFGTFDASNYTHLSVNPVRYPISDLAVDFIDRQVAVIESFTADDSLDDASVNVCRLYEVGMSRGDEEEESDETNYEEEGASGDNSSDDERDSNSASMNDDEMAELEDFLNDEIGANEDSILSTDSELSISGSDDWETTDEEDEWI